MDVANFVFTVLLVGDDFVGSPFPDGEFADAVGGGGAVDLDGGKDEVARFILGEVPGGVGSVGGEESPVFGEMAQDFGGKLGLGVAEAKEIVQVGCTGVVGEVWGNGGQIAIDGESERSADCGNAADDVCTVDGGGVPGVCCDVDCFDANFGIASALVDGDGDGFVEEAKESFDGHGLVVLTEGGFAREVESGTHGGEMTFEGRAGVGSDKETEADAEEDMLHEEGGEGDRI